MVARLDESSGAASGRIEYKNIQFVFSVIYVSRGGLSSLQTYYTIVGLDKEKSQDGQRPT